MEPPECADLDRRPRIDYRLLDTLTTIGFRLVCGFSEREVAKQLGVPHKKVVARLDALRDELAG
jgi:hypothetical protein